jgi:Flp pilus assembly protein TadG
VDRRSILTQAGGVALELAVTIPTLILVVLALLEVVVVARVQLELVAAAREGVRVAATVVDPAAAVPVFPTASSST